MTNHSSLENASRRHFLVAGGVTVGFSLLPLARALAQTTTEAGTFTASAPQLPGSLKSTPSLDSWIKIDEKSGITVFTGKAELGTGIRTAFIQIAADELGVPPERITLITADTAATPNEGYTAGSHSMADSGTAIENAAAQVRALLLQSAASKLQVDAATLDVKGGEIVSADGRRMSFGDAVSGVNLHRNGDAGQATKDPRAFTVIGRSFPRVDIPAKVTGGPSYVQDMRLPGMVHARVVRPPSYGATLASVDTARVGKMPGVIAVVKNGSYLAVVADDEWRAIVAMRELAVSAKWNDGPPLPEQATIHETLMKLPAQEIAVADVKAEAPPAAKTLHARFEKPYMTHGSIGPSCAIAQFDGTRLTVWTHTQGVFPLRNGLAEMLSMPREHVRCVHVEGSGCYGHNGADDVAADAAFIAHAVPGRPVRVQWMREQEHAWEPFGPAMVTDVTASLDASGQIVDWRFEIWSNSHNNRIENAGRLMPTWFFEKPFVPAPPKPIPMPEGGGDRNSIPLYRIPNVHVQHHFLPDMPIRVSAMRSLGAYHNIFSIESFVDELAAAAGADPVAFRLRHLDDPRAQDVIREAARRFGWTSAAPRRRWHGRGVAFAKYKNLMAYCAIALEVMVEPETGAVKIGRVASAIDCGQIVNPDGVRNQVEGGIVQSASWTLFEETTFDRRTITSYDWSTYPILRFDSVPQSIEVDLIDRPGQPFLGVGEASQGPMAAALANAVADATGQRIRELPLSPPRLAALLRNS
ncbi:aldehyde dehydrogenase [Trinickia symbiotica]|uniref:Aldehyde dehydrogenase n=1 Tax=Trinickia symbiotica TaxID=863227 RepID=A0A2T3XY27_9BURK|nr:molybdopterin cofactor-binding domain-containing protein [Trinickia symbiotica]PTB21417.1 aldehyde dehydrogenase [Trinickia symbiotica]